MWRMVGGRSGGDAAAVLVGGFHGGRSMDKCANDNDEKKCKFLRNI